MRFDKEFLFLSNSYPVKIEFENKLYPSVEHAYQAAKTLNEEQREIIRRCSNTLLAVKEGRRVEIRKDWEEVRIGIMYELLKKKFRKRELRERLLKTGEQFLVDGNDSGEIFWGVCNGRGRNILGHLLMSLRDELRRKL